MSIIGTNSYSVIDNKFDEYQMIIINYDDNDNTFQLFNWEKSMEWDEKKMCCSLSFLARKVRDVQVPFPFQRRYKLSLEL